MKDLATIRAERALSQEQLGALIGVTGATISRYEARTLRPSGKTLSRMLSELPELDVRSFYQGDGSENAVQS